MIDTRTKNASESTPAFDTVNERDKSTRDIHSTTGKTSALSATKVLASSIFITSKMICFVNVAVTLSLLVDTTRMVAISLPW